MMVGHLVNNPANFRDFFAPDPSCTPDQRDGLPEPDTFGDFCMHASRRNYWADGLMIMGLAQCLGRVFIIFCWNENDKAWQRHVIAPKFDKGLAKGINGAQEVCLLLRNGHYRSFVPKTNTTETPQAWFRETPLAPREKLRGAGKNGSTRMSPGSGQSSGLDLPPNTPGQSSLPVRSSNSNLSLPRATPQARKSRAQSVAQRSAQSLNVPALSDPGLSQPVGPDLSNFDPLDTRAPARPDSGCELSLPQATPRSSGQRQQTLFESFDVKSQSNQVNPPSPEVAPPVPPKPRSWHRMQIGEVWWSCHLCNFRICKVQGTYGHFVNIFLRNILPKRMSFPNFPSNSIVRFLRNFTVGNGTIFFKLVLSTDGRVCTSFFVTKNRGANARSALPTAFYPMKFLPKSVINSREIPSLSLPLRPARRFGTNGSMRPIKRPVSTPKKPVSNKNRLAFRLGWPNKIFGMPRSTLSPKPNEVAFKD